MWPSRILAVFVLALLSGPAAAGTFGDTYWGGVNTQNTSNKDVIGSSSVFDISYVDVTRTNGGNTLQIVIHTAYAGAPGTSAALGTNYGSLFLTSVSNYSPNPVGNVSNHYANDVYQPNDWTWAFVTTGSSSTTGLYQIGAVQGTGHNYGQSNVKDYYTTLDGKIIMSNMNGNPITAPNSGNSGYYFRQGQAVQFVPNAGEQRLYSGSMSVSASNDTITYYINDYHTLGDTFAMSWAMTCANDVFQRVVSVPGPIAGAGLPGLVLLIAGWAWRARRRVVAQAAAAA